VARFDNLAVSIEWNEIDFRVLGAKRLMGLKVPHDGYQPIDSLERQNALETNFNLMINLKERPEAPQNHILNFVCKRNSNGVV
jgi:hypothetical protein